MIVRSTQRQRSGTGSCSSARRSSCTVSPGSEDRMNRLTGSLALLGLVVVAALALRPPFPFDGKGPPKGYKLGKLMPPHVREGLDLTDDQEQQLRALED